MSEAYMPRLANKTKPLSICSANNKEGYTMENEDFEAFALTGYDWKNNDYTEDYPHEIVAHVDGNIETWQTKCIGGFLKYYRAKVERYTEEAWYKSIVNDGTNSVMDDITREDFAHYAHSGLLFG